MLETQGFCNLKKSLSVIGLIKNVKFFTRQSNATNTVGALNTSTAFDQIMTVVTIATILQV